MACTEIHCIRDDGRTLDIYGEEGHDFAIGSDDLEDFLAVSIDSDTQEFAGFDGGTIYSQRVAMAVRDLKFRIEENAKGFPTLHRQVLSFWLPRHKYMVEVKFGDVTRAVDAWMTNLSAPLGNVNRSGEVSVELTCGDPLVRGLDHHESGEKKIIKRFGYPQVSLLRPESSAEWHYTGERLYGFPVSVNDADTPRYINNLGDMPAPFSIEVWATDTQIWSPRILIGDTTGSPTITIEGYSLDPVEDTPPAKVKHLLIDCESKPQKVYEVRPSYQESAGSVIPAIYTEITQRLSIDSDLDALLPTGRTTVHLYGKNVATSIYEEVTAGYELRMRYYERYMGV